MKRIYLIILVFSVIPIGISAQVWDQSVSNNINPDIEEGEPHIAINPTDSNKMVLGYVSQNSSSVGFKIFYSHNGGNSWQASSFNTNSPISSDFHGHTVIGGGDIIMAFDKSGKLYTSWIYLLADMNAANPYDTAIWASYWASSADNGATFTLENGNDHFFGLGKLNLNNGISVHNYADGICDRQWMAVDLSNGPYQNNLYVGFINYPYIQNNTGLKIKTKTAGQNTFGIAVMAYPGNGHLTNIVVDTNGTLHYTFANIATNKIYHTSSVDGGQNFSQPHFIYNGTRLFPQGNTHINERENSAPSFSIDGSNNLHLVWGDFPIGQQPKAFYARSTDGGLTWSTPLDLSALYGAELFMPVVSSHENQVTIGGYVLDSANKSNYYIISSTDNGQNFGTPVKLSSGITDFNAIGGGAWVGDYSSGVRTKCFIYSLWTDCRNNKCKQYIAKYNQCNPTGIVEYTPVESDFYLKNIFPIPAEDELSMRIKSNKNITLKAEIFNNTGQIVLSKNVYLNTGEQTEKLNITDLSSGSYILRISDEKATFISRTFVKK